jgi:hypothetical protein
MSITTHGGERGFDRKPQTTYRDCIGKKRIVALLRQRDDMLSREAAEYILDLEDALCQFLKQD